MFVKVADAKDIAAGQMLVVTVGGTEVNLSNSDGRVYAFDDTATGPPAADGSRTLG